MKHALALLLSAYPLSAFSADTTVEEMTVYATRTDDSLATTPATVTILERKDLDRYDAPGANLGTVLGKMLPGIGAPTESVSNFGQALRGRDILILIDGIPQLENRQVSRQLNTVKMEGIERVEVIYGANAIYGSGAPGGIINIITKSYSAEKASFESSIGTSFSTNPLSHESQTWNAQETVSGSIDKWRYLVSIGAELRNNRFDAKGDMIAPEPAQTSRNDTDSYDASVKLGYQFDEKRFFEAGFQLFEEQQDTDVVVQLNLYRAEGGLILDDQPRSKRKQATLRYDDKDFLGHDLSVQAYYRQREMSFFPFELRVPVPLVNQSNSKADVFGLKSVIQTVLTPSVSMAWGIDAEMDKGNQKAHGYNQLRYELSGGKVYDSKSEDYDYGPSIDTQKIGLFTQFKADINEELHSKFGLRYEQIAQKVHDFTPPLETAISRNWSLIRAAVATVEGNGTIPAGTLASLPTVYQKTNFKGGDVDYDAWAANFGLSYDIAPKQLLFFNYSQGYELADTARLMRDAVAPGSLIPKISPIFRLAIGSSSVSGLELEAIKTSSYEIGWRGAVDRFFGNAAIFYNQSDKIYQFNRDFTVDLLNREKRVYGAEADIGYRPTDSVTLGISHSRAKGEAKRANGQGWTAVSAMELSPPKTAAYIDSVFTSSLSGSLQAQYLAPYNKADDFDAAEYTTVDGNLNYAFNEASQVKLGVTNLLNRRYRTLFHQWAEATYGAASGAPAEGRRLSITYRQVF